MDPRVSPYLGNARTGEPKLQGELVAETLDGRLRTEVAHRRIADRITRGGKGVAKRP